MSELESIGLVQTAKAAIAGTRRVEIELTDSVLDDVEDTERQIHRITRKFGLHVVLVLAVSASDAFLYLHWHNGRVVRSLGCSLEDEGMWSRVSGDPEGWEAEAFDGEEVLRSEGRSRRLGRNAAGEIEAPLRGDISVPPDVMKYAQFAREFHSGVWPRPDVSA